MNFKTKRIAKKLRIISNDLSSDVGLMIRHLTNHYMELNLLKHIINHIIIRIPIT